MSSFLFSRFSPEQISEVLFLVYQPSTRSHRFRRLNFGHPVEEQTENAFDRVYETSVERRTTA